MYPFVPLKHSIATFLLTILCISAHSQTLTQFSHYTVDDGLSENNVTSLLQDRKGNMWFGTYDGLNKFDGYSFKIFDNNFSLTNYRIDKIKEDCFGYIWVQANDGRVYRFDPSAEKFLAIPQGIGPYRTFKQSLKIFGVFDDGTVWLSNNDVNSPVLRIKSFAGSDKIEITSLDCKIARQ